MKRKIIIDNDGGTDDFIAIMYAILSKKFDVKALTLVAGNTDVNNVKNNNFLALHNSKVSPEEASKIGVYLPRHVNTEIISDGAQGSNGLGGVNYKKPEGYTVGNKSAEDVLVDTAKENPHEITIIATGPLTNIARAIQKDHQFIDNVKEIVIMGGDEGGGNITPYAEFNIYQDPESAKQVFEAGFKNITMIGFNVSKKIGLCPEIETFLKTGDENGKFLYDITRTTAVLDRYKNKVDGASMNDVLTLLYLTNPNAFSSKPATVDVDIGLSKTRGKTIIGLNSSKPICNVVTDADAQSLLCEMLLTLFPDKSDEIDDVLARRKLRVQARDYLLKTLPNKKDKILSLFNSEEAEQSVAEMVKFLKVIRPYALKNIDPTEFER